MNTEGTSQFSSCLRKGPDLHCEKFVKTYKTLHTILKNMNPGDPGAYPLKIRFIFSMV